MESEVMEIVNEYLNIFFKLIVPWLGDQLMILLQSWPFVILFVFLCLRKPLILVISGIRELQIGGTHIITQNINKSKIPLPPISDATLKNLSEKQENGINNTQNINKNKIPLPPISDATLKNLSEKQENEINKMLSQNPQFDKEQMLMRKLALYLLAIDFDRTYICIFRSQLEFLIDIYSRFTTQHQKQLNKDVSLAYYKHARCLYPKEYANFSFEIWFNFLVNAELIKERAGFIYGTDKGASFVKYIIEQRYNIREKIF